MPLITDHHVQVNKDAAQIENSSSEKLLGVTINAALREKYQKKLNAKARAKLKALARIAPFMNIQKKSTKAFFTSQFSCFPLIWM